MLLWVFLLAFVDLGTAQEPCGRVFRGIEGIITSPGYPNNYPDGLLCEMEIVAPPNMIIELEVVDIGIEQCFHCRDCDYLELRSIKLDNSRIDHGMFCGNGKFTRRSDTNHMWILFKSDSGNSAIGFRAFYRVIGSPNPRTFWCSNPIPYIPSSPSVEQKRHESAKARNVHWLVNRINNNRRRKGWELPRAILALFLAEPKYFSSGNQTGADLRERLTVRLFSQTSSRNATIRSQELALYVNALLVSCENPRDFFGRDLVSELRAKVDGSTFANPFEILALCNSGGNVTTGDVDKVSAAFDSQHRPFWTDVQAMATMALQCLSSKVTVDERTVRDMQDELKKRQFENGTVENLATTGLVVQALKRNGSSDESFDLPSALEVIMRAQEEDGSWGGSLRNSFYLLPALSGRSFVDIGNAHCPKTTESEGEPITPHTESVVEKFVVQYWVWMGSELEHMRAWKVKANKESSFYDVIETVSQMDETHNVTYQVVDGKPYVRSLLGKEDDPELGIFWFTYVRPASSTQPPTLLESSPADVLVTPNQEMIMWYKPNTWREESGKGV